MHTLRKLYMTLIIMSLSACSNIMVQQDYSEQANFSKLHSYAWQTEKQQPTGDVRVDNSLLDGRIRQAIDTQLTSQGHNKTSLKDADFYIAYHYAIREKEGRDRIRSGISLGGGRGYGGVRFGFGGYNYEYDAAELTIDVIDPSDKKLLWRGSSTRKIIDTSDPRARTARINETVNAILTKFPPR